MIQRVNPNNYHMMDHYAGSLTEWEGLDFEKTSQDWHDMGDEGVYHQRVLWSPNDRILAHQPHHMPYSPIAWLFNHPWLSSVYQRQTLSISVYNFRGRGPTWALCTSPSPLSTYPLRSKDTSVNLPPYRAPRPNEPLFVILIYHSVDLDVWSNLPRISGSHCGGLEVLRFAYYHCSCTETCL